MTDFVRKHKTLTILLSITLVVVLVSILAGQTICNTAIEQISQYKNRNKTVCTVNPRNGTQVVYEGRTYQILNEHVPDSQIGGWNGVFRKIAILDDHLRVIKEMKSDVDCTSRINELKSNPPRGMKYIVVYFNEFSIKRTDERNAIAVNLDSGTYKAVPVNGISKNEAVVQLKPDR